MALDCVTNLESRCSRAKTIPSFIYASKAYQRNFGSARLCRDNEVSAGILIGTTAHKPLELLKVVSCSLFGVGQILCYALWHGHLFDTQIRIRTYNSTT